MAVTAFASGTKTADGTEQTLSDVNVAGVYLVTAWVRHG